MKELFEEPKFEIILIDNCIITASNNCGCPIEEDDLPEITG